MTRQTESSLSSLATVAIVISTTNDDDPVSHPLVVLNNDSATLSLFGGARNFLTLLVKGEQLRLGYQYFVGGLPKYPKAPFNYIILNENLACKQFDDFLLQIKVEGNEIPAEIFIVWGENTFKLNSLGNNEFSYSFSRIHSDLDFPLTSIPN